MSVVKVINKSYIEDDAFVNLMNYGDKKDKCELICSFGTLENKSGGLRGMDFIRQLYEKELGSKACHIVVSIYREVPVMDKKAFQNVLMQNVRCARLIGLELGKIIYSKGFQNKVFMHEDTGKVHLHIIINSVNFMTGYMLDNRFGLGQELTMYLYRNYGFLQWEKTMLGE